MNHSMPTSSAAAATMPNVNEFVSGLSFQIPVEITSFCGRQQFLQMRFLPAMVDPVHQKLVILVTSRNQEWSKKSEKFKVLPLDVLTDEEALSFVLMQFEIPDGPEVREETREFIQLMGGLPLALQQSVAYIKEKIQRKLQTGQGYQYSDYINEFRSAAVNILDYDKIPGSSSSVFGTWNVTFEKIKTMQYGHFAIKIMEVLSLLYADKIPFNLIQSLFPYSCNLAISSALKLLEKYSLIKQELQDGESDDENSFVTIHRQLQFVILQNLKTSSSIGRVVDVVMKNCHKILDYNNLAKSVDIFVNIQQLIEDPFKVIPISERFLRFMTNFATALFNAGRYSESMDLSKNVYNKSLQVLGENHINTLVVQKGMVRNLIAFHKLDDAFTLCQDVLERMITHLGPQHQITLQAKYALTRVLRNQNKIDECLSLSKQLLEEQKIVVGEYDPDTLLTQEMLASLLEEQRDFPAALKLHKEVEIKRIQVLGADHPDTIGTIYNQANILLEMRKYKEASKLFNQAYEQIKQVLGENHPTTIIILGRVADVTAIEGRLVEALGLKKRVFDVRTAVLGPDHPGTQRAAQEVEITQQLINERYAKLTGQQQK